MKTFQKLGTALVLAVALAGGLATTAEANGGGKGKKTTTTTTSSTSATCQYLWSVMTYQYVDPTVLAAATSLFVYYGCEVP